MTIEVGAPCTPYKCPSPASPALRSQTDTNAQSKNDDRVDKRDECTNDRLYERMSFSSNSRPCDERHQEKQPRKVRIIENQHKHSDTAGIDTRVEANFPKLRDGAEDDSVRDIGKPRPNYLARGVDYVKYA